VLCKNVILLIILPQLKVLKLSTRESLTFPALWHLLKGFFLFLKFFHKKEGFLICIVEFSIEVPSTYLLPLKMDKVGVR
jgi:hypothetical protein